MERKATLKLILQLEQYFEESAAMTLSAGP